MYLTLTVFVAPIPKTMQVHISISALEGVAAVISNGISIPLINASERGDKGQRSVEKRALMHTGAAFQAEQPFALTEEPTSKRRSRKNTSEQAAKPAARHTRAAFQAEQPPALT